MSDGRAIALATALMIATSSHAAADDPATHVVVRFSGCEEASIDVRLLLLLELELGEDFVLDAIVIVRDGADRPQSASAVPVEVEGCLSGEAVWLSVGDELPIRRRIPLRADDAAYATRAVATALGTTLRAWALDRPRSVLEPQRDPPTRARVPTNGPAEVEVASEASSDEGAGRAAIVSITESAGVLASLDPGTLHASFNAGAWLELPSVRLLLGVEYSLLTAFTETSEGDVTTLSVGGTLSIGFRASLGSAFAVAALFRLALLAIDATGTAADARRTSSMGLALSTALAGRIYWTGLARLRPWLELEAGVFPLGVEVGGQETYAGLDGVELATRLGLEFVL